MNYKDISIKNIEIEIKFFSDRMYNNLKNKKNYMGSNEYFLDLGEKKGLQRAKFILKLNNEGDVI
jgi:hypothetical protein